MALVCLYLAKHHLHPLQSSWCDTVSYAKHSAIVTAQFYLREVLEARRVTREPPKRRKPMTFTWSSSDWLAKSTKKRENNHLLNHKINTSTWNRKLSWGSFTLLIFKMHVWTILAGLHSSSQLLNFCLMVTLWNDSIFIIFHRWAQVWGTEHAQNKPKKQCHSRKQRKHLRFADV